jgi:hypothetical protein
MFWHRLLLDDGSSWTVLASEETPEEPEEPTLTPPFGRGLVKRRRIGSGLVRQREENA